ncbi:MAG: adenosylcobinamide-GDP ribazoletransferase [Paracoccaceae bacterium]|jgi:adenosylcobinamide-GDP ribazoletransferase
MRHRSDALVDLRDIAAATGLLTRLPVRFSDDFPVRRGAAAAWAYPLVGAIMACICWCVVAAGLLLQLPVVVTAGLAIGVQVFVTGALHEDGLADTVDGFWGGWSVERRLEIMKDSQIGTYGVLALVFVVGLRWATLVGLIQNEVVFAPLLVAAMMSRAAMPLVMVSLPHARSGGLSASVGRPAVAVVVLAVVIAGVAGLGMLGLAGVCAGVGMILVAAAVGWTARTKIGGQTGDVLGATQQITELVLLIGFLAWFGAV